MSVMLQMSRGDAVIHTDLTTSQYHCAWEGFQFPDQTCILPRSSSSTEGDAPVIPSFLFHPKSLFSCKGHLSALPSKEVLLFKNKRGKVPISRTSQQVSLKGASDRTEVGRRLFPCFHNPIFTFLIGLLTPALLCYSEKYKKKVLKIQ